MEKTDLPLALMSRLIKDAGAKRVSENAKVALAQFLEDIAGNVSKRASSIAERSKRKTIQAEDIRTAVKEVWG